MPGRTNIEWATDSWNPVTGCSKVSEGCRHCYAEALALRFGRSRKPWTHPNAVENVKLHPERLGIPLRWREPRRVFVNSVSDLFHELVPDDFIAEAFAVMALAPRHTFLVLTKRPERMAELLRQRGGGEVFAFWEKVYYVARAESRAKRLPIVDPLPWPLPNLWIGTSVEDQRAADERIPHLLATPAAIRFLSCEPLLAPVDLAGALGACPCCGGAGCPPGWGFGPSCRGRGIGWVITGGESGPHHRPFDPAWAAAIRDRCLEAGVAFFHKQNGGRTPEAGGRLLDGRTWDQIPEGVTE